MKTRFFTLTLALLWAISLIASDTSVGGIWYNLNSNGTAEVTYRGNSYSSYNEYTGAVTIPSSVTYNGKLYYVESIGKDAFRGCSGLTSVTIPDFVESIGEKAFYGCSRLTSVTIPDYVESIGDEVFYGCSGLTSITISNSVTSIGRDAFDGCSGLIKTNYTGTLKQWCAIEFTSYYSNPTSNSKNLYINDILQTQLNIPAGVKNIGTYAFCNCSGVTSVTIPSSVTSIGNSAFCYCSGLTSVTIPNSVTSIEYSAFYGCSGITSIVWNAPNCASTWDALSSPFYDIRKNITSFTIGEGVTDIPAYLCYGMSNLTSVTIPNSVTSIGNRAFTNCSGWTSVTIPNSVTSIGDGVFRNCSGLTSVTIPSSVTNIGSSVFFGSAITSVVWKAANCASPSSESSSPFYDICKNITSFTIGEGVTDIPAYLCYGMSNLTSITIPESVTSIGDSAFSDCSGLTSVTIPNNVTSIENSVFSGCSGLTSVTIPESVTSIGDSAFSDCSGLTSVTIPNSVTSIENSVFSGCSGLTSVTIPESVTSIGNSAFSDCSGLTSVTIPSSVTNIGSSVFFGSAITSVVWKAANCASPLSASSSPFYDIRTNITNFTVEDGVMTIPAYLCNGMSNLTSITIPESVTSIGDVAFSNCSGLTSVTIPSSVTSIGNSAFSGCTALRKVVLGSGLTSIGNQAFAGCTGMISLQVDAEIPPFISANTFDNVSRTMPVYVLAESLLTYQAALYWNEFTNLMASSLPQATLTLNSDATMGQVYGAGTYDKGSNVQIFAIVNSGFEFTGWSDGNTSNPRTITLTDNLSLTASYASVAAGSTYEVNVSSVNPAWGSAEVQEAVVLTAVPEMGYKFMMWSDGNVENPRTVILTDDLTLMAIFMQSVTTNVSEAPTASENDVRKELVRGQVYITRDGNTYTVIGTKVK